MQELCLQLLAAPEGEREALLAREKSEDVVRWVRLLIAAEGAEFEPPNLLDEARRLRVGSVLAGRFELVSYIASGTFGDVYEAQDRLARERVAIKILRFPTDDSALDPECATLRIVDIPGVISLIDAIESEGEFALVMPLVRGSPFPGERPRTWAALETTVGALLEALERLHAAGFVHGDLKPANVLIGDGGVPAILDLGLATSWRRGRSHSGIGTPPYAAPELYLGQPPTPASDLWSVGLMLYEALAGGLPTPAAPNEILTEKLLPIRKLLPDLPANAATLVERLLRPVEDRVGSATEALALIGRGSLETRLRRHVGWLGPADELARAVETLLAGGSLDWTGERLSGRSAALAELRSALERRGERVLLLPADRRRLLEAVCAPEELSALGDWPAARRLVIERLAALHAAGTILLIDDADLLDDGDLAGALSGLAAKGRVVRTARARAGSSAILAPIPEESLRALFSGPSAVLHLPEDAARQLHARTDGYAGRILGELAAWLNGGLADWGVGGKLTMTRESIDRLALISPTPLRPLLATAAESLGEAEKRAIAFVQLAEGHANREYLRAVDDGSALHLEETLSTLMRRGLLTEIDGRLRAECRFPLASVLAVAEQDRARRFLAERLGDERGLAWWIRAGGSEEIPRAALAAGRDALRRGSPDAAQAALLEGLRARAPAELEGDLLEELVEAALTAQTSGSMRRALHEISLSAAPAALRTQLSRLLEIGLRIFEKDRASSIRALEELPFPAAPRWQRWTAALQLAAARSTGRRDLQDGAIEILQELVTRGDRLAIGLLATVLGVRAYEADAPEEAAVFHRRAATIAPEGLRRSASVLSEAAALVEAGRYEECARSIEEGKRLAIDGRFALLEARALVLESTLAYRRGSPAEAPGELFEALELLGAHFHLGQLHLNEAARHWRGGAQEDAARHAESAARCWEEVQIQPPALLARSLAAAAGAPDGARDRDVDLEAARRCHLPGIGLQVIALLVRARESSRGLPPGLAAAARELADRIPSRRHELRREVLSTTEAIRMVKARIR